MLQYVSRKPGEPSQITSVEIVKYNKGKSGRADQVCILFTGDVHEVLQGRIEIDIEDDWLLFKGNYKNGYRIQEGKEVSRVLITCPTEAHEDAIRPFIGKKFAGLGYNRDCKMWGVKLGFAIKKSNTDDKGEMIVNMLKGMGLNEQQIAIMLGWR